MSLNIQTVRTYSTLCRRIDICCKHHGNSERGLVDTPILPIRSTDHLKSIGRERLDVLAIGRGVAEASCIAHSVADWSSVIGYMK